MDVDDERRCTATAKSTGERCERPAIKGSNVCYQHGGAAPQVEKKAQERLDEMADSVTADMQEVVEDLREVYDEADDEEKARLASEIRKVWEDVLDRTGHGPEEKREVSGEDGGPLMVIKDGDD
jgi:Skp family chaperone for outer membrane proteins